MNRHLRRCALVATVVAVLAMVAGACSGTGTRSSRRLEKLTVVLDWTPNTNHAGMYLAQAKGWYRQAGLDVKIIEPGDTQSLQILGAGKADIALSAQEDLVAARAQGLPVVSVGAVIEHNTSSLVSLRSAGIARPRQLEDHAYGGFGGVLEKALVQKLTACDGGDPAKVRFVDVGNADYRVGLSRHQYDVVWIFDGWDGLRLAEIDKLAVDRMSFRDHPSCIPDWYTPLLASSEKVIATRPDAVKRFMAATARGYRTAMTDPGASAAALLHAAPELDRDLVERSARYLSTRYASDPKRWGHEDRKVWSRFVAFVAGSGLIDRPIDVDAAFTNRFLPDAR